MANAVDDFVDKVYDELERLYNKDKNFKKQLLGNEPIKTIFSHYDQWLANNIALSPNVAANVVYKDVVGVGYIDFANKKIKKGVQIKGIPSFNLVYGTQKEIDQAFKIMTALKNENPKKFDLVLTALEKIKDVSDTVKPAKNIFGKTTNVAKAQVMNLKMPRLATLMSLLKMNDNQLRSYITKFDKAIK